MSPCYVFLDLLRKVVSLSKPREEAGTYWGYRVRYASNISSVFNNCPYKVLLIFYPIFLKAICNIVSIVYLWSLFTSVLLIQGGYDHLIGTSEHGETTNASELQLPNFWCGFITRLCPLF